MKQAELQFLVCLTTRQPLSAEEYRFGLPFNHCRSWIPSMAKATPRCFGTTWKANCITVPPTRKPQIISNIALAEHLPMPTHRPSERGQKPVKDWQSRGYH